MITIGLHFQFQRKILSHTPTTMAYVQLTLLCVASLCFLAPCMSMTPDEARAVVWKASGEAMGEAKAKLAMLVKATQASATTPEQRSCVGKKVGLAFQDAKMRVHQATMQVVQFGHDHGVDVASTDVETARKAVTDEFSKVVNSVVKDNEQLFKQCLA